MAKGIWEPDRGLIENGWFFFSQFRENKPGDVDSFRKRQEKTFRSTITLDEGEDGDGNRVYSMYVRGFPKKPDSQVPGGGFLGVGIIDGEDEKEQLKHLTSCFKSRTGKEPNSILRTEGPVYSPSSIARGQYETSYHDATLVCMR